MDPSWNRKPKPTGSTGLECIHLHENHKHQPVNVGKYIPYMNPIGKRKVYIVSQPLFLQVCLLIFFEGEGIWVFPKIMVPPSHPLLIEFSIINHPFWGTPIFGNTHIFLAQILPWFLPVRKNGCLLLHHLHQLHRPWCFFSRFHCIPAWMSQEDRING